MTLLGSRVGGVSRCRLGLALVAVCLVLAECLVTANPLRTSQKNEGGHGVVPPKFRAGGLEIHKRPKTEGPCAHVGDAVNFIAARAYMAPTVFIGKVMSMSTQPDNNGEFGCTFVVQRVLKDKNNNLNLAQTQVRFKYLEKKPNSHRGPGGGKGGACYQSYNFAKPKVKASIKRGGKYIVFANGVGPHNLTFFGEPVPVTKKNRKAVKSAIKNYSPANVSGLTDPRVDGDGNLKLICRSGGNPLPALSWYKNGIRINTTANVSIEFRKKRSTLNITGATYEDSGIYECKGFTVTGKVISVKANVTIPRPPTHNLAPHWQSEGSPCHEGAFCLNGGTCTFFQTIGEIYCTCPDDFKGLRCEMKTVFDSSSMYRNMPFICKLGVSSSYYC